MEAKRAGSDSIRSGCADGWYRLPEPCHAIGYVGCVTVDIVKIYIAADSVMFKHFKYQEEDLI